MMRLFPSPCRCLAPIVPLFRPLWPPGGPSGRVGNGLMATPCNIYPILACEAAASRPAALCCRRGPPLAVGVCRSRWTSGFFWWVGLYDEVHASGIGGHAHSLAPLRACQCWGGSFGFLPRPADHVAAFVPSCAPWALFSPTPPGAYAMSPPSHVGAGRVGNGLRGYAEM